MAAADRPITVTIPAIDLTIDKRGAFYVFQPKTARGVAWLDKEQKAGAWREGALWVEGIDLGIRMMLVAIDAGLQVSQLRPTKTEAGKWVQ